MLSAESTSSPDDAPAPFDDEGGPGIGLSDIAMWVGEKKVLIGTVTLAAAAGSISK